MIIVNLKGGMGNQMFQYALGKSLSLKNGVPFKLDLKFLLDRSPEYTHVFRDYDLSIFNLEAEIADQGEVDQIVFRKTVGEKYLPFLVNFKEKKYVEKHFQYDNDIENISDNVYLDGYWQTPKYFSAFDTVIRKDFSFKNPLVDNKAELKDKIVSTNSICINIRRTDFLNTSFHGVCNEDYYERGIELIKERKGNDIEVFVFADDMQWCIENLKFKYPTHFVGHEYAGTKFQDYLQLMTCFSSYVIPNSTFGWWAAYLSQEDEKIVVTPEKWFAEDSIDTTDLIPSEWLRI